MTSCLSTDTSTLNDSISYQNRMNVSRAARNDLPPEPLSKYYEERKKIIFSKKDVISNENLYLNLLKKSQLVVNDKCSQCIRGGFFGRLQDIYNLSVVFKENIANYSLVFSLYFIKGENLKAYQIFILMCEQNKPSINFLLLKIIEQLPKIANNNKIALFYPMITKTMLQTLSIFIKLSGKFHKPNLEKQYIILYFKIVHILSSTVIRYKQGNNTEISNQLKNERRYFYASFLFDSSLYLFNRYQPLSTIIDILQHIIELYGNKLTFYPDEIESILLLKVSFNLGLFCYINGNNNESINNLIQARERLLDIKYFPKSTIKNTKFTFPKEENNMFHRSSIINNSSTNLCNLNEYNYDFNTNINNTRSKNKRASLNSCGFGHGNERKALDIFKERNVDSDREHTKKNLRPKYFSNIYLGAYSILTFQKPILLDQVKEKILVEIELILSEIELNRKNYKESLNHINTILKMNSYGKSNHNRNERQGIIKSKTISSPFKNDNTSNGKDESEENKNKNKFTISIKSTAPSDSNLLWINQKKNNNSNNKLLPLDNIKLTNYVLTNSDRNRMMFILENIENANNGIQNAFSDSESLPKYNNKNVIKRNESLNKDKKVITSKEMEKFFIFICNLSLYQLKILNQSQPEPSEKRNDLPIVFNNQFQDCLTNAQRKSLFSLETMGLTRYILLKDTNKEICPENLDYRFMRYRLKDTDPDDEISKKIKNIKYIKGRNGINRNSSCDTFDFPNNYISRSIQIEFEEENSGIDIVLNKIISDENKNFIKHHRNDILTFIKQMSKEDQKLVLDNPKLLKNIINKTSKKYNLKIQENGGNNNIINDKHVNFLFEKSNI